MQTMTLDGSSVTTEAAPSLGLYNRLGAISEGATWNVTFFDGTQIVWPDADILPGVTAALPQTALSDVTLPGDECLTERLERLYPTTRSEGRQ